MRQNPLSCLGLVSGVSFFFFGPAVVQFPYKGLENIDERPRNSSIMTYNDIISRCRLGQFDAEHG
jgi:hypothetical protein